MRAQPPLHDRAHACSSKVDQSTGSPVHVFFPGSMFLGGIFNTWVGEGVLFVTWAVFFPFCNAVLFQAIAGYCLVIFYNLLCRSGVRVCL